MGGNFRKLYIVFVFMGIIFGQTVNWLETTQSDFADGYIDPNLYASWRRSIESVPAYGAIEWFPRFDLDGNGCPDFISADFNSPYNLRIWFMGVSGLDHSQFITISNSAGDCDFADLNVDGDAELIHSGYWVHRTTIYWNNSGTFSDSDTTLLLNDDGEAVYVADLDADGYLDIIVAGDGNTLYIHWGASGLPHGWSVGGTTTINMHAKMVHNIECADLDNDADLDLLIPFWDGDRPLIILRNLGARTFETDTLLVTDVSPNYHHGLSVGDLDKNGYVDVVATNYYAGTTDPADIFLNDGTGFSSAVGPSLVLHPGSCYGGSALHDFNDDGWLDILFFRSHPAGSLKVCLNSGGTSPIFSDATCYDIGPYEVDATGGTIIDANDDGIADIYLNIGDTPAGYSLLLWGPSYNSCDSFSNNCDHHGVFREPGNIRDRSESAFYKSGIFDTGFEHGACSGDVSWVAYDERDYSGMTFPDPIGSAVIILGRGGDTPLPDASWTDWDTLTDDSPLPMSIMGHRYYQYRAELWYSNPAYLPWLERIEFNFSPCSCPTIDSVWFSEETDADNRNLVRVCYIANDADGDSFLVDFNVYDDTVPVPATTIYDTISGYPGNDTGWVHNGEHCFVWDMGADYPGYEGCDFDIQISIHNETTEMLTVTDSFPIPDAEGIAWDGQHLWVSRTHDVPGDSDTLVIYEVDPITHEILDSCAFLGNITGRYADMEWHNDTLWIMKASNYLTADPRLFVLDTSTCTMVDSSAQLYSSRWGQGIAWNNGYFWVTDSHGQIYRVDPFSPYSDTFWMSIEDTFWAYHPAETLFSGSMTADAIVFALGYMWLLRNPTGSVTYILFQIDSTGQVVDSFELPAAGSYGPEGITFDGSCFWYTDHTNDMVYRVCLWGCDDTITVRGCLDSHLPEPQIDTNFCSDTFCCDDSLTSYLTVIDSFYNIPCSMCSLLVMCGTDTDTITELTDSIITLPIDFPFCDSAYLVSVVYDSFGNRGVDTSCAFLIAPCAPVSLSICPPYISYNSCINPAGIFHIEESDSTAIDTTAAFFTIYIYEDGVLTDSTCVNSPNPAIIWSGSEWNYDVSIFPSVADGDSVIITLDSLFNIYGCKIYP